MSEHHDYYVYLHVRDSDGVVFYVGKGRGDRAMRSRHYAAWISAKGDSTFTPVIYADNLSNKDALDFEKTLILNPHNEWELCNKKYSNSIPNILVKSELEDHFYYCPSSVSGLRWKRDNGARNPVTKRVAGDIAGTPHKNKAGVIENYQVRLRGSHLSTHRIVWVLCGNTLESGMVIDHIDGNVSNNNISNLQQVSFLENSLNRRLSRNNVSGINGVQHNLLSGYEYWVASYVNQEGVPSLKYFSVLKYGGEQAKQLAIEFRQEYEKTRNFSERHGK